MSSERTNVNNILFLARIEKAKGIYTAINAFNLAFQINKDLTFTVAGDGSALSKAKEYCKNNKTKYTRHLNKKNPCYKELKCDKCNEYFKTKYLYNQHINRKTSNTHSFYTLI